MDKRIKLVKQYFRAFSKGDVEEVLGCFSEDAQVKFGGDAPRSPSAFYPETAELVKQMEFTVQGAFTSKDTENILLHYTFLFPNEAGDMIEVDAVDISRFDNDGKIEELRVIHYT